jgi:hypothetical protein
MTERKTEKRPPHPADVQKILHRIREEQGPLNRFETATVKLVQDEDDNHFAVYTRRFLWIPTRKKKYLVPSYAPNRATRRKYGI